MEQFFFEIFSDNDKISSFEDPIPLAKPPKHLFPFEELQLAFLALVSRQFHHQAQPAATKFKSSNCMSSSNYVIPVGLTVKNHH